jgi:hypothetical protein
VPAAGRAPVKNARDFLQPDRGQFRAGWPAPEAFDREIRYPTRPDGVAMPCSPGGILNHIHAAQVQPATSLSAHAAAIVTFHADTG